MPSQAAASACKGWKVKAAYYGVMSSDLVMAFVVVNFSHGMPLRHIRVICRMLLARGYVIVDTDRLTLITTAMLSFNNPSLW